MKPIPYIDRLTGKMAEEKVYGGRAVEFIYGENSWAYGLKDFLAANVWVSAAFGWWQKQPWTRSNIVPFIKNYGIDDSEFLEPLDAFQSFNDFFIRKLKASARPIASDPDVAVMPADGRYLFFENVDIARPFCVKGRSLNLRALLQNDSLAKHFAGGSAVMARLCPSDYHRFHFPCEGMASLPQLINGLLYSVNPMALKQNLSILWENKRMLTVITSEQFGKVGYVEIGAMAVGSIHQTYNLNERCQKGQEKGFFSFGGSMLILLFEPNAIRFDQDLLNASQTGYEIRCLMGQSMGKKSNSGF